MAIRTLTGSKSNASTRSNPNRAAAIAKMPDPVPISIKDGVLVLRRWDTNCRRQNIVVGCCPVPKLSPGSRTIESIPLFGFRLLQVGFTNNWPETRIGLKCRFQVWAQFSLRTGWILTDCQSTFKPTALMSFNPVSISFLFCERTRRGSSEKAVTVILPERKFL